MCACVCVRVCVYVCVCVCVCACVCVQAPSLFSSGQVGGDLHVPQFQAVESGWEVIEGASCEV